MVESGQNKLGGDKEEGGRGRDSLGVGVRVGLGIGIECGPRQRGGVEAIKQVKWSRLEWGGRVTPIEGQWLESTEEEIK